MTGSLYFIQEGVGGAVKIGWTANDPHRRRDNLQIGNSHDLILLGILPDVEMQVELEWHTRFERFRKRSEWFWPAAELMAAIAGQFPAPPRETTSEMIFRPGSANIIPLVDWMKANRVRQTHLAQHLGVAPSTISRVITGASTVSKLMAMQIEAFTQGAVPATALLGLDRQDAA